MIQIDKSEVLKRAVKKANKDLYDIVAERYEEIDGRRSEKLEKWLKNTLVNIRKIVPAGRLIDLGTGNGFVTRCAKNIFNERVGLDISPKIIEVSKNNFDIGVCTDLDNIPFPNSSFDVATCFSVLHHLYDFDGVIDEITRILKSGGVFYSDHDMDSRFYKWFRFPLMIYRKFYGSAAKYKKIERVTEEMYYLSEFQEKGINSEDLASKFEKRGFVVKRKYHWYGLDQRTDLIFGKSNWPRGLAPIVQIIAIKK